MLMRLSRGTLLQTHHKMGLPWTKGSSLNAGIHTKGTNSFPPPYPYHTAGPTIPPRQAQLQCQNTTHDGRGHIPPLDKAGKKFIQEVCGTFLFLAHGINGGILPALSTLTSQQVQLTENTMKLCKLFLDYMESQEEPILTYKASSMVLAVHSNASYLSKRKAHSHAVSHMFMSTNTDIPDNNGAVLNTSQIIRAVMLSAAEAELGALFINTKHAVSMRHTLKELGHPQQRTRI